IFLTAHGHTYCRDILDFNSWFQKEFSEIGTPNKIYLMESCFSGEFVELFYGPSFAMSSVEADSYAIGYTGDNGTWVISEPPFIGGISAHFWAKAINDTRADTSGDGVVSLVEMTEYSLPQIRKCYNETFEHYPDVEQLIQATAGYTENYPIPIVINNLYYDITLNATDYILHNNKYKWEDDIIAPEIECLETIYFFEDNSSVTAPFLITDRSDFSYYCYVNGIPTKQGKIEGPYAELQLQLKVEVKPGETHNVSVAAVDEWGNEKTDFTFIIYDGKENNASFGFWSIGSVLFLVAFVFMKRKISRKNM
ncbi:MAG: hypothetical protein ACXABK_03615, partial [Candidatus Heimdallarchaeaceae archaeon]